MDRQVCELESRMQVKGPCCMSAVYWAGTGLLRAPGTREWSSLPPPPARGPARARAWGRRNRRAGEEGWAVAAVGVGNWSLACGWQGQTGTQPGRRRCLLLRLKYQLLALGGVHRAEPRVSSVLCSLFFPLPSEFLALASFFFFPPPSLRSRALWGLGLLSRGTWVLSRFCLRS